METPREGDYGESCGVPMHSMPRGAGHGGKRKVGRPRKTPEGTSTDRRGIAGSAGTLEQKLDSLIFWVQRIGYNQTNTPLTFPDWVKRIESEVNHG